MATFEPPEDYDLLAPDQSVEARDMEFVTYTRFSGLQQVENRVYYRQVQPIPTRPGFYRTNITGNATGPRVIELLGTGTDWVDVSDEFRMPVERVVELQPLTPLLTEQEWAARR